jgi:transcriptional regulator with XRE-family HTH domain
MLKIHQRIKNERVAAGLTEDEMAEKLNIGRSTYQYWEKKDPSIDKIKLVAKALGKDEDYFFIKNDENHINLPIPQVNEDPAVYNKELPVGDLGVTLKDYVTLLIETKNKAEEREQRLLALLEKDMSVLKTNSETIQADLEQVARMVRADDMEIMEGTDKALGRESGTTALRAGIVERAFSEADKESHTTDSKDKRDSLSKGRRQGKD